MQKIEAVKLLTKIFSETSVDPAVKPRDDIFVKRRDDNMIQSRDETELSCVVILSDELVFQKCVEDTLIKKTRQRPKIFDGNQAFSQYNQYVRQNNLFEPLCDALVILDENFTAKKVDPEQKFLLQSNVFIFGKVALRHYVDEKIFPHAVFYLCYPPNDYERQKCAEILAQKYTNHKEPTQKDINEFSFIAQQALMHYNNDLYHCALHFERMQKSGLNFSDAILLDSPVSGFDVVQTLLERNLNLLDMRLYQHATNGEEAGHILRALIYFFKQLVFVHAELVNNTNLSSAFLKAKIPYPAQNNIKKAIQMIPYAKIEHFFSICAQLEIDLRERKNAYQILFLELSQLIHE